MYSYLEYKASTKKRFNGMSNPSSRNAAPTPPQAKWNSVAMLKKYDLEKTTRTGIKLGRVESREQVTCTWLLQFCYKRNVITSRLSTAVVFQLYCDQCLKEIISQRATCYKIYSWEPAVRATLVPCTNMPLNRLVLLERWPPMTKQVFVCYKQNN